MLTDLDYELLSAYIDGTLTESERAAFESRLQSEPELRRELDELRATVTLLNNLPPLKAPRDFTLDARYTRRSSFFFTSATFSALSTAAAIILFALGAYLFTGNNAPINTASAPAAQQGQFGQAQQQDQSTQFALLPTATSATLDKSAAATNTSEADVLNSLEAVTLTVQNSPAVVGDQPTAAAQSSLSQSDAIQPPASPDESLPAGSVVVAPTSSEKQGRTAEATETITLQQYAAPAASANTANDSTGVLAVPPSPTEVPANDGAPALPMTFQTPSGGGAAVLPSPVEETEANANTGAAVLPTQLPMTATAAPRSTLVPTVTATPSPQPTATLAPTATHTSQSTSAPTLAPTLQDQRDRFGSTSTSDSLPLLLIGLGIVLLLVAIGTTIIRRHNRP